MWSLSVVNVEVLSHTHLFHDADWFSMAHNIQMPVFGAASGVAASSYWGDIDNLDVDMLAEYLLDDGNLNANGVTFDFVYVRSRRNVEQGARL
jgi:hypothetical protein